MFKSFARPVARVAKKLDKTAEVYLAVKAVLESDVLVGIPEHKTGRKAGEELTNAEIGFLNAEGVRAESMREEMEASGLPYQQALDAYLHEHGDPLWHVPPRPFLEPSLEANADKLAVQKAKILKDALDGKLASIKPGMNRLGMLAQNIVKGWFTDPRNNWAPNAPATIAAKGSDRPLIDSGQLRNSITYVVRDKNA